MSANTRVTRRRRNSRSVKLSQRDIDVLLRGLIELDITEDCAPMRSEPETVMSCKRFVHRDQLYARLMHERSVVLQTLTEEN
jgi:hypothetical protein